MTLDELTKLAHEWIAKTDCDDAHAYADTLARAISDLLADGDECGWERPTVNVAPWAGLITVPDSWAGPAVPPVSPADARAMARMLLRAADEAEGKEI